MIRYTPSRVYLSGGLAALGLAGFCGWWAWGTTLAWIPSVLSLVSAVLLLLLASRPPIEVHEAHLMVGKRIVPWEQIQRVDRTGWVAPLIVHLKLAEEGRLLLIYAGDMASSRSLLRHLRRLATEALIDGVPYRQFWGEARAGRRDLSAPRYPLLCEDDEAEVLRLYQRLKSVGHLDQKGSDES